MKERDEHLQQICQEGITWRVHPDNVSRLREQIIPFLFRAEQSSGSSLIKETDTRIILKSKPDELQRSFIVKVFKRHPLRDVVKGIFRSPRAFTEWQVGLTLMRKAIPAPIPIAAGIAGKRSFSGKDYFISQEVAGAQPLAAWVEKELIQGSLPFAEKCGVIRNLAAFIRTLHDRGVYSTDLHQGNILIIAPQGKTPQFYLTDFHAIRFRKEMTHREKVKNLVQLNSFKVSVGDRLRFLKEYLREKEEEGISTKPAAREIGAASHRHWKHLWDKRKRKCLRQSRGFEHYAMGQWRGMMRKDRTSPELRELLEHVPSGFSGFHSRALKEGSRTAVNEVALPTSERSEHLVIKYYHTVPPLSKLKVFLGMSRAKRAWINAHQLVMRGIPTPTPVAFGEKGPWGIWNESILLTEKIPRAQGGDQFLKELPQQCGPREERTLRKHFLVRLGGMIRWMHVTGLCHGDLKASNILVTFQENRLSVFLVDTDGMKMPNKLGLRHIARDLSRLKAAMTGVLSESEYEYFLTIYRKGNRCFQKHEKQIMQLVHTRAAKKISQKQNLANTDGAH